MKIEELEFLKKYANDTLAVSCIKEHDDKLKAFYTFFNMVEYPNIKNTFTKKEMKNLIIKYRDSIYGQTFFEMLTLLKLHGVEISDDECKKLCKMYINERTSDKDDYRNMIQDLITMYGDCNGYFTDEYVDECISKEMKRHFSITVEEYLKRNNGSTIGLKDLLNQNGITKFDQNTKLYYSPEKR